MDTLVMGLSYLNQPVPSGSMQYLKLWNQDLFLRAQQGDH
jgi:hypothetical protein